MPNKIDLTGKRIGKLVVIEQVNKKGERTKWLCKCDCGNEKVVSTSSLLRKGRPTLSCGCERIKKITKHGCWKVNQRLYRCWSAMKQRCFNQKERAYKNYGGRGIKVCDEWKNDFKQFFDWALKNNYADDLTLDRIDVDGNYEPANCRWISKHEQAMNRRTNLIVQFQGVEMPAIRADKLLGYKFGTTARRLRSGWTMEQNVELKPSLSNQKHRK